MIIYSCQDCRFADTDDAAARAHEDDTWHRVTTAKLERYAGARTCQKDQHLSWPCSCTRSAPVLAPAGEPLRVAVTLTTGQALCERHAADRHEWLNIDPGSDLGKRLAVPGINLVQIGSPAAQLKWGEHWTVKFRRVIRSQVDVIDLICAAGTACRNLVPPLDIDPRQHCISTVCPSSWTDHRATRCLEIQPGRCGCGTCYPEGTPCP